MCVLQRDAIVRNAEASRNYRRKPQKAHTTNASPSTQAYNATSHKRQSPNQTSVKASNQHTTLTSHPVPPRHQTQTQGCGTHRGRDKEPRSADTTDTEALGLYVVQTARSATKAIARDHALIPQIEATRAQRPQAQQRRRANPRAPETPQAPPCKYLAIQKAKR